MFELRKNQDLVSESKHAFLANYYYLLYIHNRLLTAEILLFQSIQKNPFLPRIVHNIDNNSIQ